MTRQHDARMLATAAALVALGLTLGGCGGGGGGGGPSGNGNLVMVSFVGFPTAPSLGGPNTGVTLPEVFIDQTLEFTFDGPISPSSFGGFLQAGGAPQEFLGVAPSSLGGIPYFAFVNQGAAANSIQIRVNATGGPLLNSYIVGRHRDKPNTLVVDPRVTASNPFGLPFSVGFTANTEYTYRIPPVNGILVGANNQALPIGVDPFGLPLIVPSFSPQPGLSILFRAGASFGPDPIPPEIVSIVTTSGINLDQPSPPPVPTTDGIVITFSKPIDQASINRLENAIVRNTDLTTPQNPMGTVVFTTLTWNQASTELTLTPNPSFGPGLNPGAGIGFDIEVRVGTFGMTSIDPILGQPTGPPPPVQLPVSNSRSVTFTTIAAPGAQAALTVVETFDNELQRDAGFTPAYRPAPWGTNPQALGRLVGEPISGTALATFQTGMPGTPLLGSRTQVTVTPMPLSTAPAGLISPFDDAFGACLAPPGSTVCVNPMGGSHIMHGYMAADLANTRNALELIEWGPVQNFVIGTTYAQFRAWCGMTSTAFPMTPATGGTGGLSAVFSINYNLPTDQTADPGGQGGVAVTAGPVSYSTGSGAATPSGYFPFPLFNPPFLYRGAGAGVGNLVVEQNIEPGQHVANFNRYRATAIAPVRRVVARALSTGVTIGDATGFDIYDQRFTFVSLRSSAQSLFYDTGVPTGSSANYVGIQLDPSPFSQPAGTTALWEFEGATAIATPSTPAPGAGTGFQTFFSGDPANGIQNPGIVTTLNGRRYIRFRVTLDNNTQTNMNQRYDSVTVGVTF